MSTYKSFTIGRTNPFLALLFLFIIMFSLFWVAKGIYSLLSLVFPVMIIATAIINYRVLFGFGKWLLQTLRSNPLMGIAAIVFTVVAHPLVGAYLLFRAISTRGEKSVEEQHELKKGEYIQYEEVEDDFLDLSEIKKSGEEVDNKYKDLF